MADDNQPAISEMSDTLTRRFRSQLTVAMDAVLRKAVMDIMSIFETSVSDYQKEMSLKDERLVQLVRKMEKTELQLTKLQSQRASAQKAADAAVQTSYVAIVNPKPLSAHDPPSPLNGRSPRVEVRRLSVDQCPRIKSEVVEPDQQPPQSAAQETSNAEPSNVKTKKKQKRLKQTAIDRGTRVIFLSDVKDGYQMHCQEPTEKPEEQTPIETDATPALSAARFVLKKQVTGVESRRLKKACRKCLKMFPYPDELKRHTQTCDPKASVPRKSDRIRRLRSSTGPKELRNFFSCQHCMKKYSYPRALLRHTQKHEQEDSVSHSWTEPIEDDLP